MLYALLFAFSFGLTYLVKNHSVKKSLLYIPNDRSSHSVPIPHGGGIAVAITWFIGIGYLFVTGQVSQDLFYALAVGILIALTGYLDDLYDLNPKLRFTVQFLSAAAGLWFLGGLNQLDFGIFIIDNFAITNIIAIFAIIWFINLYNFLDGIDGYAGSEAVFLGIAGYLLFGEKYFLILVFSVLGFLVWNWHKAKIFMGDIGSTLLGYNIAIFAIYSQNNGTSILIWLALFGLFWFDATLTLFRRYKNGEKLSQAHRKHAYQRLTQIGWSHSKVTISSIFVNIVIFSIVYTIHNPFVVFLITLIILYIIVRAIASRHPL